MLCDLNFDLYYTGLEGEFKSLFTQSDVLRIKEVAEGNFGKSLIFLLSAVSRTPKGHEPRKGRVV